MHARLATPSGPVAPGTGSRHHHDPTTAPAIEVTGVRKSYGTVPVLCGVDAQVRPGEVFALLGPNGAGKTTLVRILATLVRPDAGQIRVAGYDLATQPHRVRRSISLTGQYAAVDELLTGLETLRMMGRLWGLPGGQARRRATELLERFDLTDAADRQVRHYSGGMRRRLDIAASLVGRPPVIFLDEPTTGLDLPSRQTMWAGISQLASQGTTILLTTQYLEEADRLAGHVAILDGGRIVATGTPGELKARVGGQRLEITLTDRSAFDEITGRTGRRILRADRQRLAIDLETDGTGGRIRALLDELDPQRRDVRHFALRSPTLDDVFLALTGHAASPDQETSHD